MWIKAALRNARRPDYEAVTIPFPIPTDQYDSTIKRLEAMDIGDPLVRDCKVEEIHSKVSVLKCLEGRTVNVDELDYLAKRLDSFDRTELGQFQGMAAKLDLSDMTDLINLTFCCQEATVITDFSDLEKIGRAHYMNLSGGGVSLEELEQVDGVETGLLLITENEGTVTPYGVVYDNGMKLEQVYDGRYFPCYYYEENLLTVVLSSKAESPDMEKAIWLYLPASEEQMNRAMVRAGVKGPEDMQFRFCNSLFPKEVDAALDLKRETISDMNTLARAAAALSQEDRNKLGAVVTFVKPESAVEICRLAENLDQFDFDADIHTPTEYGRYMIQESDRFDYDSNLEEFYDYEKYGLQQMEHDQGMFTDRGHISYHGSLSLEELLMGDLAEQFRQEQDGIKGMGGFA